MIQYPNNSLSLLGKVKTIKCLSKVLLSQYDISSDFDGTNGYDNFWTKN